MTPMIPTWETLRLVSPELWLGLGMVGVILAPFVRRNSYVPATITALLGLGAALWAGTTLTGSGGGSIFSGMLTIDPFSQFIKILVVAFALLVVAQWLIVTRQNTAVGDVPDMMCLLLGAAFGMCLMASASNLLMIFIATEAASYPSYALAGFRKRYRTGSEGSLKYVIFGSAASAVMVYGMSLVYGATGTLSLEGVAAHAVTPGGLSPLLAMGLVAMLAGVAFKLSAVPMHFWCPDVFEGAPTEITTFLSVASKAAAIALLSRVLFAFAAAHGMAPSPSLTQEILFVAVGIMGGVTATWGNLVAFHQDNIKRLLAYSSIAHAGYMIMGVSLIAITAPAQPNGPAGVILFYVFVYMFMNLGAFTVAAIIANATGSENIRDYTGLIRRSPLLATLMAVFLLSLFGMPGLGGFTGKLFLGLAMADKQFTGLVLAAVLLLNTLISLYFYMRPIYYMFLVSDDKDRPSFQPRGAAVVLLATCAVALVWTGILPNDPKNRTRDLGSFGGVTARTTAAEGVAAPTSEHAVAPSKADDANADSRQALVSGGKLGAER